MEKLNVVTRGTGNWYCDSNGDQRFKSHIARFKSATWGFPNSDLGEILAVWAPRFQMIINHQRFAICDLEHLSPQEPHNRSDPFTQDGKSSLKIKVLVTLPCPRKMMQSTVNYSWHVEDMPRTIFGSEAIISFRQLHSPYFPGSISSLHLHLLAFWELYISCCCSSAAFQDFRRSFGGGG